MSELTDRQAQALLKLATYHHQNADERTLGDLCDELPVLAERKIVVRWLGGFAGITDLGRGMLIQHLAAEVEQLRAKLANAARQADHDAGVIADLSAKLEAICDALAGETNQRQELQSALAAAEQRAALAPTPEQVEALGRILSYMECGDPELWETEDSQAELLLRHWLAVLRGGETFTAAPLRLAGADAVDADPDPA